MNFLIFFLAALLPLATAQNDTWFHVRTATLPPSPQHNALWVTAYHTGAGLSDAALLSSLAPAHMGRLDNSSLLWFNSTPPFGWNLRYGAYTLWNPVTIDGGSGSGGFAVEGGNIVHKSEQWGGWLVCDWNHGVPQLFWLDGGRTQPETKLPVSCNRVELKVVPVTA
ncbi:hypothetical protein EJ06DRAFT_281239 [Trichodelitschia bisporula]|uniref:DUF7907 domain-containing protein n=1 Tax=Trichodelitschia bisporula TaxID=703511 RepID=A0A6G1I5V7_9PEZI|nr:hypothetical protein EJ06DRAFT_281239 [Trichodelitschia bisporula]